MRKVYRISMDEGWAKTLDKSAKYKDLPPCTFARMLIIEGLIKRKMIHEKHMPERI